MCKVVCFGCAENISLAEFKRVKWCFFYNSESFVRVFRAFRGYIYSFLSEMEFLISQNLLFVFFVHFVVTYFSGSRVFRVLVTRGTRGKVARKSVAL